MRDLEVCSTSSVILRKGYGISRKFTTRIAGSYRACARTPNAATDAHLKFWLSSCCECLSVKMTDSTSPYVLREFRIKRSVKPIFLQNLQANVMIQIIAF